MNLLLLAISAVTLIACAVLAALDMRRSWVTLGEIREKGLRKAADAHTGHPRRRLWLLSLLLVFIASTLLLRHRLRTPERHGEPGGTHSLDRPR